MKVNKELKLPKMLCVAVESCRFIIIWNPLLHSYVKKCCLKLTLTIILSWFRKSSACTVQSFGYFRPLAISCTCMHGRPCTSSPLLPRPHDTCCRSGGCSHSRLRPSSRTFPAASGSGHRCARRTAGHGSLRLSFEAPGARVSCSWGQDEGNQSLKQVHV